MVLGGKRAGRQIHFEHSRGSSAGADPDLPGIMGIEGQPVGGGKPETYPPQSKSN